MQFVGPQRTGVYEIFSYQNRLLILQPGTLSYDSTGFFSWSGNGGLAVTAPYSLFGTGSVYVRAVEANKNLYLTSELGILKLAAYNGNVTLSGVPPALDGTGVLAGAGSGFLGSNTQCAYQIVFGYVDVNGNLNLGSPSERILVVNSTGGSDNVTLTFTVPQNLNTTYFYQIYRTPQTTYSATPSLNVPPGAEPQLASQFNLTSGQISALSVTVTDVTTDPLLGAALYTNPSQQGALQPNTPPPFANDMCTFSQMMFYANGFTPQTLDFSMISVGAPNGIQLNDTITVNGITFTAKATQNNASQQFAFVTTGTIAQNIDTTARNLVQCINANAGTTFVYAFYLSGYNQLPGLIGLQAVTGSTSAYTQFFVTSSRGSAFSPIIPPSGTTFGSTNDVTPNGVYVSKVGQPEAVPAVNLLFVGGGDQPILRILPLRDRVIVLKTDGVFVITGTTPATLSVTLLDSTIICIVTESARVLNNSVYCMSQQGVVSITESGVTIQSRAIEQALLSLTGSAFSLLYANAISYESERLYILNLPTVPSDVYPTQAFCYNWVTNVWTRWPIKVKGGLVNPFDNLLYSTRDDLNAGYIYQERKQYTYLDYVEDLSADSIASVGAPSGGVQVITLTSTPLASWLNDFLEQTTAGISYVAQIVAVNPGANQVTVSLSNSSTPGVPIPWVASFVSILVPIPMTLQYAPITGNFPHYFKLWGRMDFWFTGGNFQSITAATGSDLNLAANPETLLATGFPAYTLGAFNAATQAVQTIVPPGSTPSRFITPSLTISFPGVRLSCLGVTASYEIQSDVSG